ncbi:MAG TPA: hypothetical protein VKL40_18130, partial [Candidatus Angelobacter sp.]|nr:hypothetical protein [Candidatus Angelobacter sp.]
MNNRKQQWILAVVLSSLLALVMGCEKKKTPPPPPPPPRVAPQMPPPMPTDRTVDLSATIAISPGIDTSPISYGKIKFVSGALTGQQFDVKPEG